MYWDSYIIRSFYNNGGNAIFNIGTGTATSSDLSINYYRKIWWCSCPSTYIEYNISLIIIERSDDVAVPVHILNITFPNVIFSIGTGTATSSDLSMIMGEMLY
jgi:hypothetical protein